MRMSRFAVMLLAVCGLVAVIGCASTKNYAPSATELAMIRSGGGVVVFPADVRIPGVVEGAESADVRKYVSDKSTKSIEDSFAKAGYRIIPMSDVEQMRKDGIPNIFSEKEPQFMSLLSSHLDADLAVFTSVTVDVKVWEKASETVCMRIHDTRSHSLISDYRWCLQTPSDAKLKTAKDTPPKK